MSRSYQKHPHITDTTGGRCSRRKYYKRLYNKRIRKHPYALKNMSYKKRSNSWDICDYSWKADWDTYKNWPWVKEMNEAEAWAEYKRKYLSK